MSRWYRAYAGTVKDDKLAEVSVIAGCSRSVSIAVWHAILESAAETDDGGRFDTTPRRVAAALCEPLAVIQAVFDGMSEIGMIGSGGVTAWKLRQYESDKSTERSRKHRETKRNGDATLQGRCATPPETDTDTERTVAEATVARSAPKNDRRLVLAAFDGVISPERAEAVIDHRKGIKSPLTAHAAALLAKQFAKWPSPDEAADMMIARGWRGFEPSWAERDARPGTGPPRQAKRNTALDGLDELERRFRTDGQPPNLRIAG